jgi:hypothetical protein
MIGLLEFQKIPLKVAFLEPHTFQNDVAPSNRKMATSRKDDSSGTLRSNRHGLLSSSLAIQLRGPSFVSPVSDYNGVARISFPNDFGKRIRRVDWSVLNSRKRPSEEQKTKRTNYLVKHFFGSSRLTVDSGGFDSWLHIQLSAEK